MILSCYFFFLKTKKADQEENGKAKQKKQKKNKKLLKPMTLVASSDRMVFIQFMMVENCGLT